MAGSWTFMEMEVSGIVHNIPGTFVIVSRKFYGRITDIEIYIKCSWKCHRTSWKFRERSWKCY